MGKAIHTILFLVVVTAFTDSKILRKNATEELLACGPSKPLSLSGDTGTIVSPGFHSGQYPPNADCSWTITAPEGMVVKLLFEEFELEHSFPECMDVFAIFTGTELDFNKLETTLCGRLSNPEYISRKRQILILFKSNENREYLGFKVGYSFTKPKAKCEELLCRNEKCVPLNKKCDRVDDCGDGTDEENCGFPLNRITPCGLPKIQPNLEQVSQTRIVGGSEARPGSWPWQVQLQIKYKTDKHTCGASLLNELFILTAAHCFKAASDISYWTVHFGKHSRNAVDPKEQLRYMAELFIHPLYEGLTSTAKAHDIAVVRLNAPVRFGSWVRPICLPSIAGRRVLLDTQRTISYVTGWGNTLGTGFDDVLKQATVPLIRTSVCKQWYTGTYNITETMLCAGYREGRVDSCQGDSGGPLVTQYRRRWYLIGVVSFGDKCGLPERPGVYVKVSSYEKWITKTIKNSMNKATKKGRSRDGF